MRILFVFKMRDVAPAPPSGACLTSKWDVGNNGGYPQSFREHVE